MKCKRSLKIHFHFPSPFSIPLLPSSVNLHYRMINSMIPILSFSFYSCNSLIFHEKVLWINYTMGNVFFAYSKLWQVDEKTLRWNEQLLIEISNERIALFFFSYFEIFQHFHPFVGHFHIVIDCLEKLIINKSKKLSQQIYIVKIVRKISTLYFVLFFYKLQFQYVQNLHGK